ncbi:RHS repeat protein [Riemerella anatipestifer]|uniref:hypothetical protein n=1 Tax=Riemerella anatipestifer TaxID=34085 RepID=UPI0030BB8C7C
MRLIVFIVFFLIQTIYSQHLYNASNDIFPPTPEATSIVKNANISDNFHEGSSSIRIPIYKLKMKDFIYTIDISYNTKGIQVAEISSSIGLGWTLNSGGMISRQVRGRPDERPEAYSSIKNYDSFQASQSVRRSYLNKKIGFYSTFDDAPDIFYFNFNGYSGKFIINPVNNKVILQSLSDLKVDISEYPRKIVVRDPLGNLYYFGENMEGNRNSYDRMLRRRVRELYSPYSDALDNNYITGWPLMAIRTSSGSTINIEYREERVKYYFKSDIKRFPDKDDNPDPVGYQITEMNEIQQIPSKIVTSSSEVIMFNASKEIREDLNGSYALDNIVVLDKDGVQKNKIIFLTQTVLSNADISERMKMIDNSSNKRLFLNGISKYGVSGDTSPFVYKFVYDEEKLPSRHSTSVDYWGYFNGRNNGYNIYVNEGLVNRQVDVKYASAGSLKKILYPTGEQTEFVYEAHEVLAPKRFSNIYIPNIKNDSNFYKVSWGGMFKGSVYYVPPVNSGGAGTYETKFTIKANNKFDINFRGVDVDFQTEISNDDIKLFLYRYENFKWVPISFLVNGKKSVMLIDGDYKVVASSKYFKESDVDNFEENHFMVTFMWKELRGDISPQLFIGGGLRTREIITKSSDGASLKRKFEYSEGNDLWGILHSIPDYFFIEGIYGNRLLISDLEEPIPIYLANQKRNKPMMPLSNYNEGGKVGYSKVKEIINDGDKGYSLYSYTNYPDGGKFFLKPYGIPDDYSWARGLELSHEVYNENNKIISRQENDFLFYKRYMTPYINYKAYNNQIGSNCILGSNCHNDSNYLKDEFYDDANFFPNYLVDDKSINLFPIYRFNNSEEPQIFNHPDVYSVSFFIGGTVEKIRSVKKQYFRDQSLVTSNEYNFEGDLHYQPTSQTTTFPDGTTQTTEYDYAHEKGNQYLIDKNMVGIPLETRVSKNGKLISKVETVYPSSQTDANTYTEGLPMPKETRTLDLGVPSKNHQNITYTKYDDKGNLLEYKINGITPVAIVWGYNQTQPIAKIEGVGYDYIKKWVLDMVQESNKNTATEKTLLQLLNAFRNRDELKNFQVTTYTYEPLVGVTSITPPSGITEYYKYDAANRLEKVVDADNKVLKEYKYNYKQ